MHLAGELKVLEQKFDLNYVGFKLFEGRANSGEDIKFDLNYVGFK